MADAADLKSADGFLLYGFESRLRQFLVQYPMAWGRIWCRLGD